MVKPLNRPPVPPVTDGAPGPNAVTSTCTTCGRPVDEDTVVAHGLRGSHTCKTAAGVVPPYADPDTDEERAATKAARARRFARHAQVDATIDAVNQANEAPDA